MRPRFPGRMRFMLCVVAFVGLLVPASARAALPWSAPLPLDHGSGQRLKGAPSITGNVKNLAVAYSTVGGGLPLISPGTDASVFTNGVFLDPSALTPGNRPLDAIAGYGDTRLLASGLQYTKSTAQAGVRVRTAHAEPRCAGRAAPARALDHARPFDGAGGQRRGRRGDGLPGLPRRGLPEGARLPGGQASGHVDDQIDRGSRTATARLPRVAAAVNERGDALAVWTQNGSIYATLRTAGGKLRARQTVGKLASPAPGSRRPPR